MFVLIVRSLLGILLLVFGMNGFLHFMEPPEPPAGTGREFMQVLTATEYMWPVISGVKVLTGALLLFKRWVPFALILLAPLSVNIVLYHAFLDPAIGNAALGYTVAAANLVLGVMHQDAYRSLFR